MGVVPIGEVVMKQEGVLRDLRLLKPMSELADT
jgi:hypothetical protein